MAASNELPNNALIYLAEELENRQGKAAVDSVLQDAGLPRAAIQDPDHKIEAIDEARFVHLACALSQDPDFGLWAAIGYDRIGHITEYLARHSETLGHAIRDARLYAATSTVGIALEFDESGETLSIRGHVAHPDLAAYPRYVEFCLASILGLFRAFTEVEVAPIALTFTHVRRPVSASLRRAIGCDVSFVAAANELLLPRPCIDLRMVNWDANLHQILRARADALLADLERPGVDHGVAERTEAEIVRQLTDGNPTASSVAREMGMSQRTLSRRLEGENRSFSDLLKQARMRLAQQYLSETNVPMSEIAFALGYAGQSAFSTAFRKAVGKSPLQFRQAGPG